MVGSVQPRHPGGTRRGGQFAPKPATETRITLHPPQPQKKFDILRELPTDLAGLLLAKHATTTHAAVQRAKRLAASQPGQVWRAYAVDRGLGDDRLEAHIITETAEIHIYSLQTGRLITILFARPAQIVRYVGGERVPQPIMDAARNNVAAGKQSLT